MRRLPTPVPVSHASFPGAASGLFYGSNPLETRDNTRYLADFWGQPFSHGRLAAGPIGRAVQIRMRASTSTASPCHRSRTTCPRPILGRSTPRARAAPLSRKLALTTPNLFTSQETETETESIADRVGRDHRRVHFTSTSSVVHRFDVSRCRRVSAARALVFKGAALTRGFLRKARFSTDNGASAGESRHVCSRAFDSIVHDRNA